MIHMEYHWIQFTNHCIHMYVLAYWTCEFVANFMILHDQHRIVLHCSDLISWLYALLQLSLVKHTLHTYLPVLDCLSKSHGSWWDCKKLWTLSIIIKCQDWIQDLATLGLQNAGPIAFWRAKLEGNCQAHQPKALGRPSSAEIPLRQVPWWLPVGGVVISIPNRRCLGCWR